MFAALEHELPVSETAENVEKEMAPSYLDKLKSEDGETLPNPLKLENTWLKEEGIKFWPLALYPDIFNFLAFIPVSYQVKT